MQLSAGDLDLLLKNWTANCIFQGGGSAPFQSTHHMQAVIDSIPVGDAPWEAFKLRYSGALDESSVEAYWVDVVLDQDT
jgi:hypothetical protein